MTARPLESGESRPDMNMTALIATGSPAGAIFAIAPEVEGFVGILEAGPFLMATGLCGSLLGLILYRKRR
jgi:hypothetical protein